MKLIANISWDDGSMSDCTIVNTNSGDKLATIICGGKLMNISWDKLTNVHYIAIKIDTVYAY